MLNNKWTKQVVHVCVTILKKKAKNLKGSEEGEHGRGYREERSK